MIKTAKYLYGFTLLELMVYVGLLSILLIGSWAAVFHLMANMDGASAHIRKQEEIDFIVAKLHWLGMGAQAIAASEAGVVFTNETIGVDSPVSVRVENNKLVIVYGGGPAVELLPSYSVHRIPGMPAFAYGQLSGLLTANLIVDTEHVQRHIFFP